MLENQEPQENQETPAVVVTVEDKLMSVVIFPHNYLEVADAPVKPILDALGLEPKGVGWYSGPTADEVTIRQELIKLNKLVVERTESLDQRRSEVVTLEGRVSELEEYLDENWDDIDDEVREKLCQIFRIEETVEKEVTISMSGSVTVTAPRGYNWDNIDDDIDFDVTVSVSGDLETYGYGFSVDESDIEVE
jgi:hypothetical protein